MQTQTRPGRAFPLGATLNAQGVHFSVYSKNSTGVELLLFDDPNAARPSHVLRLSPERHRTFHYWHIHVPGLRAGQVYAYRAYGPCEPQRGFRFDSDKVLLDAYGLCVAVPDAYDRRAAACPGDNAATALKSVVADPRAYDWERDVPPYRPFSETVIYEMHVGGLTRHPNSGVAPEERGTYAGLVRKIPYLVDLGITAVELMPVFQFDEQEAPPGLSNYWGYNPVSFFAPHTGYSAAFRAGLCDPLVVLNEFRDMVKAMHRAGIEVILDVVYNHTAEGDEDGPTLCLKGLDNSVYYILDGDGAAYADYSGCGNTLNANQSIVRRLILDSLRYWVAEMHVDGFRFDLASILARDERGEPMASPPVLWDIETDPVLSGTKLIAEAWDAAGLYQVGSFAGDRWQEWNGRFRDDVRAFVKGDPGTVLHFANRFWGSPDLYGHQQREPEQSINFCTSHDGFTLNDLVSYNRKHNQANWEGNRDGHDDNLSWNCGAEGPIDDPQIERLRVRQIKNFLTIELLALGTPMLLMGDEVRRTQRGNNNAWCQDNEISWFDWSYLDKHAEVHRFVRELIHFRHGLSIHADEPGLNLTEWLHRARIGWHGVRLGQPDLADHSHSLAFTLDERREHFYMALNAYWEPLAFELPPVPPGADGWRRVIDTDRPSPDDFHTPLQAPLVPDGTYTVQPRSVILLVALLDGDKSS